MLPPSEIGELALFARRSGDRWFVAAMNGPAAKTAKVDLRFLGKGRYQALIARDQSEDAGGVQVENRDISRAETLTMWMRAGGGFVVQLRASAPSSR